MQGFAAYRHWLLIAILGMGFLLTACGQKGPLYLPDAKPEEPLEPADRR
jgi:predicted small lipoprotein YifL